MTDPLGQSQVLPYLAGLSKMGYEITLLSFEKKTRFQQSADLIRSICERHNIRWVYEVFSTRPPVLSKVYDSWRMRKKARELHREHQFSFTHCRSYVSAAAGLHLFTKKKLPYLFDMRGFWVDERVDNGQWNLKNPLYNLAYNIYKKKEKKYFSNAAHIISLTEKGKEELVANYSIPAAKISVIPCCADLQHFDYHSITVEEQQQLKEKVGVKKGDKVLTYLGSLGGWYLTDEMLAFFSILKQKIPAAKFLFITQDKRENIIELAKKNGITAGDILAVPATRQQVPGFLSISDWSIFFIKDAYSKKASSPTKQGEIMAMGVPIICNDIGDTGKIIKESGAGIVVSTLNNETYNKAVQQLDDLDRLSKADLRKAAFNYYDLNKGVASYANVYKELTK